MSNGRDDRTKIDFTVADRLKIQKTSTDVEYLRGKVQTMYSIVKWAATTVVGTCLTVLVKILFL